MASVRLTLTENQLNELRDALEVFFRDFYSSEVDEIDKALRAAQQIVRPEAVDPLTLRDEIHRRWINYDMKLKE